MKRQSAIMSLSEIASGKTKSALAMTKIAGFFIKKFL
jgi:hypothetical protein